MLSRPLARKHRSARKRAGRTSARARAPGGTQAPAAHKSSLEGRKTRQATRQRAPKTACAEPAPAAPGGHACAQRPAHVQPTPSAPAGVCTHRRLALRMRAGWPPRRSSLLHPAGVGLLGCGCRAAPGRVSTTDGRRGQSGLLGGPWVRAAPPHGAAEGLHQSRVCCEGLGGWRAAATHPGGSLGPELAAPRVAGFVRAA
jgi:hypothetical protein